MKVSSVLAFSAISALTLLAAPGLPKGWDHSPSKGTPSSSPSPLIVRPLLDAFNVSWSARSARSLTRRSLWNSASVPFMSKIVSFGSEPFFIGKDKVPANWARASTTSTGRLALSIACNGGRFNSARTDVMSASARNRTMPGGPSLTVTSGMMNEDPFTDTGVSSGGVITPVSTLTTKRLRERLA